MNLERLKQAEAVFLQRYPGGFANPELSVIRQKKHNVDKMIALAQERFAEPRFNFPDQVIHDMAKVVSQSSIISAFEKPRFKDFVYRLGPEERNWLASGLEELLHGNERAGFETILDLLKSRKLGKWSLMTVCQTYYHPKQAVFVKPTTVKGIIQYFELTDLQYRPTPTWEFYQAYRSRLLDMKSKVDSSLSPTNVAFSWFLLLSLHGNFY